MSQRPIDRSPDLKKLRDEGYDLQVVHGYLLVHDIPYLVSKDEVGRGVLIFPLSLTNDVANKPADHTADFAGVYPRNADGSQMTQAVNSEKDVAINDTVTAKFYLSVKPVPSGVYPDFYAKVTQYVRTLGNPARGVDPTATAKTFPLVRADEGDSIFHYVDTASSRAEIVAVTRKMALKKIAILGVGGTGGYILDLVVKSPVEEIHIVDGDIFQQHNAFRAPGAASGEELEERLPKVVYFERIYSKMRRGIVPHPEYMSEAMLDLLNDMDFVFMSMEAGPVKALVVERLEQRNIPFIDVGMGVYLSKGGQLGGTLRTTTSSPKMHAHLKQRIPFSDGSVKNEYDKNIQIAELNALHAALAVIRWKKLFGFYADLEGEHYSTYAIARNETNNEDQG